MNHIFFSHMLKLINKNRTPIFVLAEIADTNETIEKGLMDRDSLSANAGMLFDFKNSDWAGEAGFWMKNTSIPLSAAFFNEDGVVVSVHDMQPHDETVVEPPTICRYGLEVNQGSFKTWGITPGCKVAIPKELTK